MSTLTGECLSTGTTSRALSLVSTRLWLTQPIMSYYMPYTVGSFAVSGGQVLGGHCLACLSSQCPGRACLQAGAVMGRGGRRDTSSPWTRHAYKHRALFPNRPATMDVGRTKDGWRRRQQPPFLWPLPRPSIVLYNYRNKRTTACMLAMQYRLSLRDRGQSTRRKFRVII